VDLEYVTGTVTPIYSVNRIKDANTLTRVSAGQGLRLYADGTGYTAPDGTYSVPQGEALRNPPDIVQHMILERARMPATVIDGTSWTNARNVLGGVYTGFVTSDYEETWVGELGQYAWENRFQIITEETNANTVFRILVAEKAGDDHFVFPRSDREITQWRNAVEDTRELDTIFTRWRWYSEPNRALLDQGFHDPVSLFARAITLDNPDGTQYFSDLPAIDPVEMTRVETAVGARDAPPHFLVSPRPVPTDVPPANAWADQVAEYYISESKRFPAATVLLEGVPWSQGYDVELGDVIDLKLSGWVYKRYMRVLGYSKHWDTGLVDLVCIEVNAK
jgi:hypothetical protein